MQAFNITHKMKSLPNLLNKNLKTEDKRLPFDPVSLLNVGNYKYIQIKEKQDLINPILPLKEVVGNLALSIKQYILIKKKQFLIP